ncbi:MAG: hypothetical protein AAGF12_40335 [Myxococcota bacterium]
MKRILPAVLFLLVACGDDGRTITVDPNDLPSPRSPATEGVQVEVEGQSVWPPEGPSCEALIACCEGADALPAVGLFCRLSVVEQPGCAEALALVRTHIREQGHPLPEACAEPE